MYEVLNTLRGSNLNPSKITANVWTHIQLLPTKTRSWHDLSP